PLASLKIPFLALRAAIRTAPQLDGLHAPLVGSGTSAATDTIIVDLDDWLSTVCQIQPVALIIDDLRWADQGTLDALMFLLSGPSDRRLSILATLRSAELGTSHPLRSWLADIRRMPGVFWLR